MPDTTHAHENRVKDALDIAAVMGETPRTLAAFEKLKEEGLVESVSFDPSRPDTTGGVLISYMRLLFEMETAYQEGQTKPTLAWVTHAAAAQLSTYIGAGDTNTDRDLEVGYLYGMAELTLALTGITRDESYSERREEIAKEIDAIAYTTYAAPYRVITTIHDL